MLDQELFYPLYKDFDKEFFNHLLTAVREQYMFIGDEKDKEYFVKCLLCFQMNRGYRAPLEIIRAHLTEKTELKIINAAVKSNNFAIEYSWATWLYDKEMGHFAESVFKSPLKIIGSDADFNEFVLRYLISIWLVSWEGALYALLRLTKDGDANLKEMNKVLALWDFTKIFQC